MENEEISGSNDVQSSEGGSATESQSSNAIPSETAQATTQENQGQASTPFHEHPRFKELVEQKNTYAKQAEEYQKQLNALSSQIQELKQSNVKAPAKNAVIEKLYGIDPDFAKEFESVYSLKDKIAQFEQQQQTYHQEQVTQQVNTKLENLYKQHNVPDNMRELYQDKLESTAYKMSMSGKNLSVNDLDSIFKSTHESLSKFVTEMARQTTGNYVSNKKKDASPATVTGGKGFSNASKGEINSLDDVKAAIVAKLRQDKQQV